jgi:hypothetical protein
MSIEKEDGGRRVELKKERMQALKRLRQEHTGQIKAVREKTRDTAALRREVKNVLGAGPLTVPALAEAVGASTDSVLWHVMAMVKYGLAAEDEQEGDYFKYRLLPPKKKR